MKTNTSFLYASIACLLLGAVATAVAQGTAFTYQGRLNDGGVARSGTYDLQFTLYNSTSVPGTVVAGPVFATGVPVTNGLFTVTLDFGSGVFLGQALWLDIGVRTNGGGSFVTLSPRQALTSAPYAAFALNTPANARNNVTGSYGAIGGGTGNSVTNLYATVGGGNANIAGGWDSSVGGGQFNQAIAFSATVAGGYLNVATNSYATVGGGFNNAAGGNSATVAGGYENSSTGSDAFVGGGNGNVSSGNSSTIGGGSANNATGIASTVAGGTGNNATNLYATVGGGAFNTSGGVAATIPGGENNLALGDYSLAAGQHALAGHSGSFVWADTTSGVFGSSAVNQFLIRASGGVGIGTSNPGMQLDVAGRTRIRDGGGAAGVWFNTAHSSGAGGVADICLFGVVDATRVGFYGNDPRGTLGWGLTFDTYDGNVGIGTGTTYPSYKLQVNGSVAGVGPYTDTSDARYKTNVATIQDALELVERLRGVRYDWRRTEFPSLNFASGRQLGFIAQEVKAVLPEAVSVDKDGIHSVAYSRVIPVLVEAVKEQQQQLRARDEQLGALQRELAELKNAQARSTASWEERFAQLERLVEQHRAPAYDPSRLPVALLTPFTPAEP